MVSWHVTCYLWNGEVATMKTDHYAAHIYSHGCQHYSRGSGSHLAARLTWVVYKEKKKEKQSIYLGLTVVILYVHAPDL